MKGKFRIFAITFAMVMALLGGMLIAQPAHKAYANENTKHIDFTPVAIYTGNYDNGTAFLLGGTDSPNLQVTVKYKVVANTGINNIVLIPDYDRTAFSIASVTVDEATSYNISVNEDVFTSDKYDITGTEEEADYVKIAMESATTYEGTDSENTALLTVVFNLSSSAAQGVYSFGLKLSDTNDEYNNMSKANVFLDDSSLGEQEDVQIRVVANNHENEVRVLRMQDAHIDVGYNANEDEEQFYSFVYSGSAPAVEKVEELNTTNPSKVEFTYDGSATPVVTWYTLGYDDSLVALDSAPVDAGYYVVGVSAPKHGVYNAVAEQIRHVYITAASLTITIDNKSSEYGEALVALTSDNGGHEEFLQNIILSTTATSSSNAGTYPITGVWQGSGNYNPTFVEGTYTITKKAITITALDQNFGYTGEVPTIDQSKYTVTLTGSDTEYNYGGNVSLNWDETANVGEYVLTPSASNSNYSISLVSGKVYITSVGKDATYIFGFASGTTVTYDAQSHDLLIVSEQKPDWFTYSASNNVQTDANTYTISLSVTLDSETAANYTNGVTQFNSTVTGTINPAALTIKADDKSSAYGAAIQTLTYSVVSGEVFGQDDLNASLSTTATSSSNAGNYSITLSASNSNYTITCNNGTYTITKATPTIGITASNVDYNRGVNNYSFTAVANTIDLKNSATVVIKDSNNNVVDTTSVLDAGEYTIYVTLEGTDNYNAKIESATFNVNKVDLGNPTVEYGNNTATWTYPTTDAGSVNLYNVESFTYKIDNGEVVSGSSFTPTSTGVHTLTIYSDNNNYNPVTVNLDEVFSVIFTTGSVEATMPATQYVFSGKLATEPTAPEVTGQTFSGWNKDNVLYNFSAPVTANLTLVAQWNIVTYTLTFVYHDADEFVSYTFQANHGEVLSLTFENDEIDVVLERFNKTQDDVKGYDLNGYRYAHTDNWKVTETANETVIAESTNSIEVTGAWTFTLIYTSSAIEYTLTYMVKEDNGEYAQHGETVSVACDAEINYATLNAVPWFRADAWFADENRLTLAPETMPAGDLTVYGAIVFNIGQGDVNGDGVVNANDIMLYRQWIVGGYTMTVVAEGEEFATATAQTYNSNTRYFLTKVADNNADTSEDIRDVSITRMAMVGGYYWDIDSGKNVTGQEIIRNVRATEANAIKEALESGKKVTLTGNVSAETAINVTSSKDIYLDLGGNTLTVASFRVVSNSRSTITIKNGTIVTTAGITISAPYGNVVLENLTGYDEEGLVNLAAANHSLHLDGAVKFYEGTDTTVAEPTPASINVEKGTHIVVEPEAELVVEEIVVTKDNFTVDASEDATAKISISSFSSSVTVADVEEIVSGHVEKKDNGIYSLADLQEAALVGGSYVLEANIETTSTITFNEDITIEGNKHIFKVKVAGSAEVTILNAHIMNLTVAASNGFTGTLVFDGGILDTDRPGTGDADAAFYSQNNPNASFEFRNMTIGANITKGIKIFNAKAVVIDNCEFDATKLRVVQNAINSNIQSLSLVDIQLQNEGANITITNSKFIGAPQGSIAVPESVYGFGTMADSDTGAAIKLKVEKGAQFGTVTITGNTFTNNYRDILVGTGAYVNQLQISATSASNGRSGDGLQYNTIEGWTISGNTTTLTSEAVASRGVATLSYVNGPANFNKYTTRVGNIGEIVGGVAIWNIGKVLEKIDGTWYYVENGIVYAVSVDSGKAVLTPVVVSTEQELLNAMQNENCHFVVLNEDIDVSSQILVTRDVKLDLNGKKVTYVGETELKSGIFGVKRGGLLTINDTVGNGKIDASVNAYAAVILTVSGESTTGEKAKVVVNGGTLEGYYYGITGNGNRHDTELVVNGGTLYGINGSGIYNPQDGSVLVNNGSIKGFGSAIEIRAGQLEINGGVFEALTNNWVATGNGSGTTIEGAIIAISQHTTNKNITVTINDGTFTNGIRSLVMYDTVNTGRSERMNVTINGGSFNSVSNKDTVTIMARNGNLVINGGDFNSAADNVGDGCSTVYAVNHGQVTINGGTFKASAKYSGRYWTLNIYNGSTGTASMTVRGGEFEDFNPSNPNTDDNVTYVENGYVVSSQIVDEKTIYTVSAE